MDLKREVEEMSRRSGWREFQTLGRVMSRERSPTVESLLEKLETSVFDELLRVLRVCLEVEKDLRDMLGLLLDGAQLYEPSISHQ